MFSHDSEFLIKCKTILNIEILVMFLKHFLVQEVALNAMFTPSLNATMQESCIKRLTIAFNATNMRYMSSKYWKFRIANLSGNRGGRHVS